MKEEIKKIKGNLLLITNDDELINLASKNKNVTESYTLSSSSKTNKGKSKLKLKNKKIYINKIKRYFNKKSIDNIVVDYSLIKKYISCFVKNSIYLNRGNLYIYNLDEDIEYKYKTFNIDLNTGKRVNLEEAYKKLGYTQSELEEDLLKEVSELVKERCEANDILDKHEGLMSYNEKRVVSTIENDNASYFIDENKNLNIVVMTNQPWGQDNHDILYTVKK